MKLASANSLSSITSLNLHGNALSKLKPIQNLHNLKRLVASANELTKLDDLSHLVSLLVRRGVLDTTLYEKVS
jgi:Leucine-rich repeat (LRR) protein